MKSIFIIFAIIFAFAAPAVASAKLCFFDAGNNGIQCEVIDTTLEGPLPNCLREEEGSKCPDVVNLENPISQGGQIDIPAFIGRVISGTLVVVGALTLVVFIYGGFLWMTSAGNSDKVQKGLNAMLYAAIGLFIVFASYGILNLVIKGITGGTS